MKPRTAAIIIPILALILIILYRRSRTIGTPHGRVLVNGNGHIDPLQLEMEQWLSQQERNNRS